MDADYNAGEEFTIATAEIQLDENLAPTFEEIIGGSDESEPIDDSPVMTGVTLADGGILIVVGLLVIILANKKTLAGWAGVHERGR